MIEKFHLTPAEAAERLKDEKVSFITLINHGTMSVEYYAPKNIDLQSTHRQDEIYVIASGYGNFNRNGNICTVKAGDVLFVPAGMKHYFEHFSDDFATWVIFYGVDGGEKA